MGWTPTYIAASYALNFKGLPYKTVWVEFPDIEAVAKEIGAKAIYESDGAPLYTLPMLFDHTANVAVTDSWNIAKYLDDKYPETDACLPRETVALQKAFQMTVESKLQWNVLLYTVMQTHSQMNPRSGEYWRRTREKMFGKKLEEVGPEGSEARELAWKNILDLLSEVDLWMRDNEQGTVFVCGKEPTFADFVVGSHLTWMKRVLGAQSAGYQELMVVNDGRWALLVEGLNKWEWVDKSSLESPA